MSREQERAEVKGALNDYLHHRLSRREFLKRVSVLGVGALAAGNLLAACGSATGGGTASGSSSAPASGTPKVGGTFREGYDRDFSPLDPVYSNWDDPDMVAVYEALAYRDPHGNLVPMLADSFQSTDTGWVFHLREGLKFHSGAACTPQVVCEDYDLFRNPKIGQNGVFWSEIKSVTASGQNIKCATKGPARAFQETVPTETSLILNPAARAKAGNAYGSRVVDGTGPFYLTSYMPGNKVVVKRWEEYPGSVLPFLQNKGKAYLDSIEWLPIVEASQRAPELETGNVDAIKNPPPQDVDTLKANPGLVVIEKPELSNFFIWLNVGKGSSGFGDLRVRQAMSYAIDRAAIVKTIFFGHASVTYGPIPRGTSWYNSQVDSAGSFDVAKANAILDQAGWVKGSDGIRAQNGEKLDFTTYNLTDSIENQVMQSISNMLSAVGIQMNVSDLSGASFWPKCSNQTTSFAVKNLWSSLVDATQYWVTLQSPSSVLTQVNAIYNKWLTSATVAEMAQAASEYQTAIATQLPIIPIYTPNEIWAHSNHVVGWSPNSANLYPLYNDVWLS